MTEKPQVMKCPGCKQMVEVSKYGDHMLASTLGAHSSIGVIPTVASTYPAAELYPGQASTPKNKHFLERWAALWRHDNYGMVTFGFFMFCLGLIVEWYYFVR